MKDTTITKAALLGALLIAGGCGIVVVDRPTAGGAGAGGGAGGSATSTTTATTTTSATSTTTATTTTSATTSTSGAAGGGVCVLCGDACVDTETDPNHCGSCGHGCQGGSCVGAACQPVLLAPEAEPFQIEVDAKNIYWSAAGQRIEKLSKGGGAPETLIQGELITAFALDEARVYWAELAGVVSSIPKGGGNANVIASGLDTPMGVAVDATHVYWAERSAGTVMKAPKAGGSAVVLATGIDHPWKLVVNATTVYVLTEAGSVVMLSKDGGAVTPLLDAKAFAITVNEDSLFWTYLYKKRVEKMPLAGGEPITLAEPAKAYWLWNVAVDATDVYWSNDSPGGVMKVPIGGGEAVPVAASTDSVHGLALDETRVYWTTWGSVMAVAK